MTTQTVMVKLGRCNVVVLLISAILIPLTVFFLFNQNQLNDIINHVIHQHLQKSTTTPTQSTFFKAKLILNNTLDNISITFTTYESKQAFKTPKIPSFDWLIQNNITNIVLLSDSHGQYWQPALKNNILGNMSNYFDCKQFKDSGINPHHPIYIDTKFYNIDNMVVHFRECSGCRSMTSYCRLKYNSLLSFQFNITFLGQEFILDTEIMKFMTHWDMKKYTNINNCKQSFPDCTNQNSYSTQEFYLKNYFGTHGYPQILIIFSTAAHDKNRFTQHEFKRNFNFYLELLNDYTCKNKTKIIWVPYVSGDSEEQNDLIRKFDEIAMEEMIENDMFIQNRLHIFPLDLFDIARDIRKQFGVTAKRDWIHLSDPVYGALAKLLWRWIQNNYYKW
eukprot:301736_1